MLAALSALLFLSGASYDSRASPRLRAIAGPGAVAAGPRASASTVARAAPTSTSTFTLHNLARTAALPTLLLTSDVAVAASITSPSETPEWVKTLQQFQDSHAFILGILSAIVVRVAINEVRARIEKPVLDKVTEKTREQLTPNTQQVPPGAWVQLAGCIALDLVGDASELIPFLGEFTDVAYAPLEAGLIFALFKSPLLGGIGFLEEILPFTDVIPTFCIGWCLQNLWPTTPMAQGLGIASKG